jgi:diphthine synthase
MLYLIGLGLNDEHDITLRGLELVRRCSEVLLEAYTSVLTVPVERLEALYGRKVTVAERDFVESGIEPVLERAKNDEIALLVVGDPFGATTHCDVLARAKTCASRRGNPAPSCVYVTAHSLPAGWACRCAWCTTLLL